MMELHLHSHKIWWRLEGHHSITRVHILKAKLRHKIYDGDDDDDDDDNNNNNNNNTITKKQIVLTNLNFLNEFIVIYFLHKL